MAESDYLVTGSARIIWPYGSIRNCDEALPQFGELKRHVKKSKPSSVSKIEVGYKTAHMYYTYPIDDLIHLNSIRQLGGI